MTERGVTNRPKFAPLQASSDILAKPALKRSNAAGQLKTEIITDTEIDTASSLMTMNIDAKGTGGDTMAKRISNMTSEDNCTSGYMNKHIETGTTYHMKMVDKCGKTMVNIAVSPKKLRKVFRLAQHQA